MSDIQVGDRVLTSEPKVELGEVMGIWGAFASVNFPGGPRHVLLTMLRSLDAPERGRLERAAATEQKRREVVAAEKRRREAAQASEQRRARAASQKAALQELRKVMCKNFLSVDEFHRSKYSDALTVAELGEEKSSFARQWIAENLGTPTAASGLPDAEQAAAISSVEGNVQVIARAGSGKTTTLVNRTLFLIKHCGVSPSEILLLAFNRKAASEIRRKLLLQLVPEAQAEIEKAVDRARKDSMGTPTGEAASAAVEAAAERFSGRLPHVMTFHALAHALVHPEGQILFDGPDSDSLGLSHAVQDVIDEFLQRPASRVRVRELMLAHFREDWDRIVSGGFNLSKSDLLALKRSLPLESLGGEPVKSRGEKVVADFLFQHGIAYKYERNHWWSGINYKPDFTIFTAEQKGVVIEYFGMAGDPTYDRQTERKKQYWAEKRDWNLVSLYPRDLAGVDSGAFDAALTKELQGLGIACQRLTEDEIWNRIKVRSIDRFTGAVRTFIGRCRKKSWTAVELSAHVATHDPISEVEAKFIALGSEIFDCYLDRIAQTGDDDFDGLMHRAAAMVNSGSTAFRRKSGSGDIKDLRFVCIDEFQDFSELFHRLVKAMQSVNDRLAFFCVGDDWQAINGFAGSELRFFKDFQTYFKAPKTLHVATNYRSMSGIVKIGNDLMFGLGTAARANKSESGDVWLCDIGDFEPNLFEKKRHPGDAITPLVVRIANRFIAEGRSVVLLTRRNGLPWYFDIGVGDNSGRTLEGFLSRVRSFLPKDKRGMVTISTAHKYKGLEKSAVLVLDAVARSYPLMHPDWSFARIFGDTPDTIVEDERRLLYVAMTRAVESLIVVSDSSARSPFMEEIIARRTLTPVPWELFPPVPDGTTQSFLLRVFDAPDRKFNSPGGTYPIRDQLQAHRFQYNGNGKLWERAFAKVGFNLESVQAELWARSASDVVARFYDQSDNLLASYVVTRGRWSATVDRWHEPQSLAPVPDGMGPIAQ